MLIFGGHRKHGWMKNPNYRQGGKEKLTADRMAPESRSDVVYENNSIIDHKKCSICKINAYSSIMDL